MNALRKKTSDKVPQALGDSPALRRRLVDDYHKSVMASGYEPPAYHTFSDRYGGTCGIPFAVRCEHAPASMSSPVSSVQWCIERADAFEAEGQFVNAKRFLEMALEQLQRNDTAVIDASSSETNDAGKKVEDNHLRVAVILSRLGKLAMRQGDHKKALEFFMLSSRIDPLTSATYALRASCQEYLDNYALAYEEYKKYLSLNEPTMTVLAHTAQCALKAGLYEAAEQHLVELLSLTSNSSTAAVGSPVGINNFFQSPQFYESHAYYCLGLVRDGQSARAKARAAASCDGETASLTSMMDDQLSQQARSFYELAASNTEYVLAYEDAAETAIAMGEPQLAIENLHHLQHLRSDCSRYYSRTADVCAMMNNTMSEVEELSKALDQQQTVSERRQTLLRRAAVYATKLNNLDNAIVDLSLLLSMQEADHCTAVAYLQRANAFQRRSRERPSTFHEDRAAALRDYESFVEVALVLQHGLPIPSESITEAMLILADGAFEEKKYAHAARFFARAVARGWQPQELLPRGCKRFKNTGVPRSLPYFSANAVPDLLTKMYLSTAHVLIARHPVREEMFKVPYEQREKSTTLSATELKKTKISERKESEKPLVPVPAVGYQMVDEHYQSLRALEPTVFSALQYEFLELWEPYRRDVERLREDLMLTRSGKKVKRR
uniref:Uncharacterized protein n=1 Tax=Trypanosoma vivax (strain Y486) TaxID=1055687 RepID=G0U4J5_TRYVY|nr:conserved hypothetical protein [Trypanosoma vivax Y486]